MPSEQFSGLIFTCFLLWFGAVPNSNMQLTQYTYGVPKTRSTSIDISPQANQSLKSFPKHSARITKVKVRILKSMAVLLYIMDYL
jgi:hypothetical protein